MMHFAFCFVSVFVFVVSVFVVSSSSWCLGRAVVCDCGTPWTFLLPFLLLFGATSGDKGEVLRRYNWFKPLFLNSTFILTVPRRFFCCSSSLFSNVAFVLSLFVPYVSFFWCLGKAVLRKCELILAPRKHPHIILTPLKPTFI